MNEELICYQHYKDLTIGFADNCYGHYRFVCDGDSYTVKIVFTMNSEK